MLEIRDKKHVMVKVVVALNVNKSVNNKNTGIDIANEHSMYLKIDIGKSAATLPVCPFTVAYAILLPFL